MFNNVGQIEFWFISRLSKKSLKHMRLYAHTLNTKRFHKSTSNTHLIPTAVFWFGDNLLGWLMGQLVRRPWASWLTFFSCDDLLNRFHAPPILFQAPPICILFCYIGAEPRLQPEHASLSILVGFNWGFLWSPSDIKYYGIGWFKLGP